MLVDNSAISETSVSTSTPKTESVIERGDNLDLYYRRLL